MQATSGITSDLHDDSAIDMIKAMRNYDPRLDQTDKNDLGALIASHMPTITRHLDLNQKRAFAVLGRGVSIVVDTGSMQNLIVTCGETGLRHCGYDMLHSLDKRDQCLGHVIPTSTHEWCDAPHGGCDNLALWGSLINDRALINTETVYGETIGDACLGWAPRDLSSPEGKANGDEFFNTWMSMGGKLQPSHFKRSMKSYENRDLLMIEKHGGSFHEYQSRYGLSEDELYNSSIRYTLDNLVYKNKGDKQKALFDERVTIMTRNLLDISCSVSYGEGTAYIQSVFRRPFVAGIKAMSMDKRSEFIAILADRHFRGVDSDEYVSDTRSFLINTLAENM